MDWHDSLGGWWETGKDKWNVCHPLPLAHVLLNIPLPPTLCNTLNMTIVWSSQGFWACSCQAYLQGTALGDTQRLTENLSIGANGHVHLDNILSTLLQCPLEHLLDQCFSKSGPVVCEESLVVQKYLLKYPVLKLVSQTVCDRLQSLVASSIDVLFSISNELVCQFPKKFWIGFFAVLSDSSNVAYCFWKMHTYRSYASLQFLLYVKKKRLLKAEMEWSLQWSFPEVMLNFISY